MNPSHGATLPSDPKAHHETFPWKHILGFVLSLVLTFAALGLVLSAALPLTAVIVSIVVLAVLQLLVQLLLFMHLTERHGPATHVLTLVFGFFVAFTIVAGSAWIMFTFHATVA
ncbi:cytochrome aa3 quinol oxidase subunit IV [Sulfoacidibacillus thermotolerans]|uniref:Quinol oxidase subunit 4 n=1 Tax=Sulfoacidibacillus thermotolerans TaxID=1765684 RepID=A0A2U3DCK2_SULT2|nr:cytochrome aa3 quinol oxidase subunit IV [Sulfoacidibacillus thermotolerans]